MRAAADVKETKRDNRAQDIRTIHIARNQLLAPLLGDMKALQHELADLSEQEAALTGQIAETLDLSGMDAFFHRQGELAQRKAARQDELNRKRAGAEAFAKFIAARLAEHDGREAPDFKPGLTPSATQLYKMLAEDAPLHFDKLVIS